MKLPSPLMGEGVVKGDHMTAPPGHGRVECLNFDHTTAGDPATVITMKEGHELHFRCRRRHSERSLNEAPHPTPQGPSSLPVAEGPPLPGVFEQDWYEKTPLGRRKLEAEEEAEAAAESKEKKQKK